MMVFSIALYAQTAEHVVQRGETLESIAKKYGVTVDDLKQANKDATKYLYAGMKLVIPQKTAVNKGATVENVVTDKSSASANPTHSSTSNKNAGNSDDNEHVSVLGFVYTAGSFEDVKTSGHYGILAELYNIGGSGFGFGGLLGSFNFGLVDKGITSDLLQLGPNYSFSLGDTNEIRLILPVYVNCAFYGDNDYKKMTGKSTGWGWAINPKVSYGVIQAGLQFSGGFEGSKVSVGFTAGLVFEL